MFYKDFSVPPIAQPLAHRGDKITPKGYKKNVFPSSNLYDVVSVPFTELECTGPAPRAHVKFSMSTLRQTGRVRPIMVVIKLVL